jgi:hypothetical protein
MDLDYGALALLIVLLMAPAVVVFVVLNVIRVRRGKFHRQRIKRSGSGKSEDRAKS